MSKKKLLSEAQVRRFMGLAGINPLNEMSHYKKDDEKEHDEEKKRISEEELEEQAKPDFPDVDGDGDKEEPISKAQEDKKEKEGDNKEEKDLSKVPPQLRKHVAKKAKNEMVERAINKAKESYYRVINEYKKNKK